MSDDNIIPLDDISTEHEVGNISFSKENELLADQRSGNTVNKNSMNTDSYNNLFIEKKPYPQIIICSLIMIIILGIALTLVIIYPYFNYISEHGESQCSICYCDIIPYGGTCYNDGIGNEHCDNVIGYSAFILFTFDYSNTSTYCNHQGFISVDDFRFCDNKVNKLIPCYYELKDPEASIQLRYFFPSGGVVGIS